MHKTIEPAILYFGTPVAILSTRNEDGTANLAPMSSVWWLGQSCMLGLGAASQTSENLIRTREVVINLPSADQVAHVDRLALTTGRNPVPEYKEKIGYRYEPAKFDCGGLSATPSVTVSAPRVAECPVQLEGIVHDWKKFGSGVNANAFEVHITRVHVEESLLVAGAPNRIDPNKWNPLIMSFREFFGLWPEKLRESRLASFPESVFARPKPQPAEAAAR